jgi:hypothetical protein
MGDPWSGHMAFPGGRVDPGVERPARRRARDARRSASLIGAELLGRLDDKKATPRTHPDS